jgi:hypothetical protein
VNIELKYGTEKHQRILSALLVRKRLAERGWASRRARMARDEDLFRAYRTKTEEDRLADARRETGEVEFTTIEIPYSYSLALSAHTYWAGTLLGRTPVLQYQARHGETPQSEQCVEALMDYQMNVGRFLPKYFVWLMDVAKYGIGVTGHYWEKETRRVSRIVEEQGEFLGVPFGPKKKIKRTIEVPGYVGNKVFNIRPQDWLPDTRVSTVDFQRGEFCGRRIELSLLEILGAEEGTYINIPAVRRLRGSAVDERDEGGISTELHDPNEFLSPDEMQDVANRIGFELYIRLIPRDWRLGESKKPEIWVFTVLHDRVIIRAQPLGELHDEFPMDIMEYEIDGYSANKRSMFEMLEPLNNTMSWLINSHFFNVRQVLNNQFIYDPSKVNARDFTDPSRGRLIRVRPDAYGTDIRSAVHQLPVVDVTQTHLQDLRIVSDFMQRVAGVNDNLMGMPAPGGRKTATEVRGSSQSAISRMRTLVEYNSALGFMPHAQRLLQTTQQHYDLERMYRISGDLLPNQKRELMITPEDVAGFFDFVPADGTMPIDKFALANLWKEFTMQMAQSEALMQEWDIGAIIAYTMQLAGAKNVQKFRVKVTPDQELLEQRARGNLVPISGGMDGERSGDSEARMVEPRQVSGVGPVS